MSVILTAEEIGPQHIGLPVKITVTRKDGYPQTVELVEVGVLTRISIAKDKVYFRLKTDPDLNFYTVANYTAKFEFEDYAV